MRRLEIALTIAGSDSGGGAGIQADLKTFAALGVHGTSVITCLTAQNPRRVLGIAPTEPSFVKLQLQAVFSELPPRALKTGMLYSNEIIATVCAFLEAIPKKKRPFLVVDPVMIATSGAALISNLKFQISNLLALATLVTPNLPEAEALLARRLKTPEDLRSAARELHEKFGCAALVKGGHLHAATEAIDFFYDGHTELMLSAPFVRGVKTHGTGCTYSAATAASLAKGATLEKSVVAAKEFITQAIKNSCQIGKSQVLGSY